MKKHALLDEKASEQAVAYQKSVRPLRRITFAAAVNELVTMGFLTVTRGKKSTQTR